MEREYEILDFDNYDPNEYEIGQFVKLQENNKIVLISDLDKNSGDISIEYVYEK